MLFLHDHATKSKKERDVFTHLGGKEWQEGVAYARFYLDINSFSFL